MATDIKKLFDVQRNFSSKFFDIDDLSDEEREEKTREFALALHSEVSALVSGINFKGHTERVDISRSKILYESVDVIRYALAIMNVWGIDADQFSDAFDDKEEFLSHRLRQSSTQWEGQPVILVDLDDISACFRLSYGEWLTEKFGVEVNQESEEYYFTHELKTLNLSPNAAFEQFIDDRRLRTLKKDQVTIDVINRLRKGGFWIHIITARPDDNLTCRYDTYHWLSRSGLKFDRISFAPEKFIWASKTEYYRLGKITAAIDDSEKHTMEYSKHGISVFCPRRSYNTGTANCSSDVVKLYDDPREILKHLGIEK